MKVTENRNVVIELTGEEFDALYNVLGKHSQYSHTEVGSSEEEARCVTTIWEEMHAARKATR